jgi:signal transduction histidine kinase/DNA-binding NarL/FixJ family response regulator
MVKTAAVVPEEQQFILLTLSPGRAQRRLAFAVVLALLLTSFITSGPLSTIRPHRIDAFVPAYATAIFVNDFITSVLLFAQFSLLRSRALLAIASGYLFTALIVIPWMLTFPGIFAPGGLLGAGLQTTNWLFTLWHAGFVIFVIAYALLKDADLPKGMGQGSASPAILLSVAMTAAVVCAATLLVTVGHAHLPHTMVNPNRFSTLWFYVAGCLILLSVLALIVLWIRRHSVLDLWLMVVMSAYVTEFVLNSFPLPVRFSFGWYASRVCGLVSGSLVLFVLLYEITMLYAQLQTRQREIAQTNRELARANQAKTDFLSTMSHELRTPLNGILGYAQILQRSKSLSERDIEGVNVIQQSGEHLLTLINDILDLAKIEAGKFELSRIDMALAKFLRIIAEIIDVRARQKSLDFICDIAPDLPTGIHADESRLRQVLLNLLANAVKFTDRGQVSLRVRFLPPTRLHFEVQDTGIGIDAGHLDAIFQPFEQVSDPQRRLGGTGLGLAISRHFVRLMGGEIRVTSEVGAGSTFWFELDVPVIETVAAAPPERSVTGYEGPRKTVLVADDVAANRAMAIDLLSQLGFDVTEAANGREALTKAHATRPDWILMDVVMPEMDGLETTRRLRQLPGYADLPIIAMSASASGSDEQKCLAAGMNAFVPKPVDLDKLLTLIATLSKISWTYEPKAASSAADEAVGPLIAPPQQELERLHQLARLGDMRNIAQWAAQVAELDQRYRPFADQLHLMAKGYQSKAILTLVERCLESSPGA